VVEERFREISGRLEEAFALQVEMRVAELRGELRREYGDRFNQSLRRLRNSESETELYINLLEAAGAFSRRSALLRVDGALLRPVGSRDLAAEGSGQLSGEEIPLASAPALLSAVEARDTTIAARSAAELSAPLADFFGEGSEGKIGLFPVVSRERTTAVLCAGDGGVDAELSSLELLTTLAGVTLEARAAASPLISISAASPLESASPSEPGWSGLSQAEKEVHSRARRFARVQVAEMRLHRAPAVQEGRSRSSLYSTLRQEIDAAREAFRANFTAGCASMADYLHLELVRTLAQDDASLLGPDYPGPLV
jgi:hypothetical protein